MGRSCAWSDSRPLPHSPASAKPQDFLAIDGLAQGTLTITGGGDCLAYSLGCTSPQLSCTLDRPCSRVWAQTSNGTDLDELESVMAAQCVLTSLRDDVPGEFEIIWGEQGDAGWAQVNIYSGGNGSVFMQWLFNCPGCYNFGVFGRSGMLALQPTSYFDDCLADPTPANLISCVVGDIEFQYGQPPPEGYLPPYTTGECSTLETVCP